MLKLVVRPESIVKLYYLDKTLRALFEPEQIAKMLLFLQETFSGSNFKVHDCLFPYIYNYKGFRQIKRD